jgi:hypothetical protein
MPSKENLASILKLPPPLGYGNQLSDISDLMLLKPT